jgi:hypothetical protein
LTPFPLTHTGLETFLPDAHPRYARSNFAKGWAMLIGSELKEFLEKN